MVGAPLPGPVEPIVRPDGYGRWHQDGREVDFFLEYDRGTEPLDRLAAKLAGYRKLTTLATASRCSA